MCLNVLLRLAVVATLSFRAAPTKVFDRAGLKIAKERSFRHRRSTAITVTREPASSPGVV
jgi:hypothetical protein